MTELQTKLLLTSHAHTTEEVLQALSSQAEGLTITEAHKRLRENGPNSIPRSRSDGPLKIFWTQINTPLIWVLILSGLIAIAIDPKGGAKNGAVIFGVVVLNTLIGFIQEFRASRAIEALTRMVPETSTVLRDRKKVNIPSEQLVPGDIVFLASGDKVPADLRILNEKSLRIEEAALTGESIPATKSSAPVATDATLGDRSSMAFAGTLVTYGTAAAVVTATAMQTELGRVSQLLDQAETLQTPMTKALASISRTISIGIIAVSLLILAFGSWRLTQATGTDTITALRATALFAIALAVGAIPEGLPAIVTITLAIGVQRMAKRRAIIRHLPAVETLGSTTVICSDKTGTLTRNEMTVKELWTPDVSLNVTGIGYEPKGTLLTKDGSPAETPHTALRLLEAGALCNDSSLHQSDGTWKISGDPTEGALLTVAEKAGVDIFLVRSQNPRLDAIPFESENQFMATLHRTSKTQNKILVKGAPEILLRLCGIEDKGKDSAVHREVLRLTSQGLRVLGFAEKHVSSEKITLDHQDTHTGFSLIGFQCMIDPPRDEAIAAVRTCQKAGISVKMITGDHKETAQAIGRELGLLDNTMTALSGADLSQMGEEDFERAARSIHVFARVAPEHKLALVKSLQKSQNVVAMTGDGVNDAPALRQSDIGVAMGITGTAVSKEAADIVLTDDNFATIAAAVEEGRRVYDNLIKSLAFVLPTNLGLAFILIYAVLFFPFQNGELLVPVLPTQILWINLVAAVTLALPLAFEAKEPGLMSRPPRPPNEPPLNAFVLMRTCLAATLMTAGAIGSFSFEYENALASGLNPSFALREAQTLAVTTVIMFQIFYMLTCRSLYGFINKLGFFSNRMVFPGIGLLLVLQAAFIYWPPMQNLFDTLPLSLRDLSWAALLGALILPVIAIEKWIRIHLTRKANSQITAQASQSQ